MKKVKEGTAVSWLPGNHPEASDGEGYYEVLKDNEHTVEENGGINFTNTEVEFGKKVNWVKNKADQGDEPDPTNNEGHFVYADSEGDE